MQINMKRLVGVVIVNSFLAVTSAFAAGSHFHFGANTAAVNDVHIQNRTLDSYSVYIFSEPSNTNFGVAPLGAYYPGNSLWVDLMPGDYNACVTIVRDADGKTDFQGCVPQGTEIDVPVSATFKTLHAKK